MSEALLKIENISKSFGGIHALVDVSFDVNQGEIIGLIGPNGAGKTTLFNIISGYYGATSGEIHYKGENILGRPFHDSIKHGIARTFQLVHVFPALTVMENVMAAVFNGRKERVTYTEGIQIATEALEFIGMLPYANRRVSGLVINDQKKLELARILAADPDIFLLDEIIAGLNPSETEELIGIIKKIRDERNKTIVFVEHVMKAVMSISDRIVVLNLGKVIANGSPAEVTQNEEVISAYLGTTASEVSNFVRND